jgi:hypothetical protein
VVVLPAQVAAPVNPEVIVLDGQPVALVHDCDAECGDGVTRLLPARWMALDGRWTVSGPDEAATLDPSIKCNACGLHGHWLAGAWRAAA